MRPTGATRGGGASAAGPTPEGATHTLGAAEAVGSPCGERSRIQAQPAERSADAQTKRKRASSVRHRTGRDGKELFHQDNCMGWAEHGKLVLWQVSSSHGSLWCYSHGIMYAQLGLGPNCVH